MVDDPVNIYPKWQPQVMAALGETNPDNLLERVKEAEKAIAKRFEKISRSTSQRRLESRLVDLVLSVNA